jgi:hypothetical protein
MRRAFLVLVTVAACASGRSAARACDPLPTEFQSYGRLYQACSVDTRARLANAPTRPDFSRLVPLSSAGCYVAEFQMVVDENGYVLPRSVKLVRTNSRSYADAISETLSTFRFEPAKKEGLPVPQFYEHVSKMKYTVSIGGPTTQRRPPPC